MQSWSAVHVPALPGQNESIQLFDSKSQQLMTPVAAGMAASLYVCGITPYDSTHMGHASTYVHFDVLNRAWRDAGSAVTYIQNVTDVDDPLFERARARNVAWQAIANAELDRYRNDMTNLRILPPTHFVSVSEYIEQTAAWVERLIQADRAYELSGDLYFDTRGLVGTVCHLSEADMLQISRERGGDPDTVGKRHALDPKLWVTSADDEPSWETSFMNGRPGWHVECLAIALDHAGTSPITVQGGGSDLTFPHHDMCDAQAASLGVSFANAYVHTGMVHLDGHKMSKSLGNLVFVSDLVAQGIDPVAIRLTILRHHYRSAWTWSQQLLNESIAELDLWRTALAMQGGADAALLLGVIRSSLAQDLDTPAALSAVNNWAESTINGNQSDPTAQGLVARALDALLGIAL